MQFAYLIMQCDRFTEMGCLPQLRGGGASVLFGGEERGLDFVRLSF